MEANRRLVVILALILAAVVAGGVLLFTMLPGEPAPVITAPAVGSAELDLKLLQQAEYLRLDQQPVRDGSLPVQPPPGAGKANPFL